MSDMRAYLEGECHVFAVAVHRHTAWTFVLLCEDAGDYRHPETGEDVSTVQHVYLRTPDGDLFDVLGLHAGGNVEAQWLAEGEGDDQNIVEIDDEAGLATYVGDGWDLPLTAYDDYAVTKAFALAIELHNDIISAPAALIRRVR